MIEQDKIKGQFETCVESVLNLTALKFTFKHLWLCARKTTYVVAVGDRVRQPGMRIATVDVEGVVSGYVLAVEVLVAEMAGVSEPQKVLARSGNRRFRLQAGKCLVLGEMLDRGKAGTKTGKGGEWETSRSDDGTLGIQKVDKQNE